MALAAVCGDIQTLHPDFRGAFRGLIVDHGVREGSDKEASKVAAELERMGISAQILKLAWGEQDPKTTTNFETLARRLRYRALGSACWDARIKKLLVAHHADDQAETVLSRIVTGYMGTGLQGIKRQSQIPECEGMYGVDASGGIYTYHHVQSSGGRIEHGGVYLHRPLLPFKKTDLIALCQAKGVQWVEDQTNADRTLTQRNTIRYLMETEALPMAMRVESLHRMAAKSRQEVYEVEQEAKRLFDAMKIDLHVLTGKAVVRFTRRTDKTLQVSDRSREERYHIKATLLRKLLLLVSPCNEIALQDLDQAMDIVFPEATPQAIPRQPTTVQIAGVNIRLGPASDGERKLLLTRSIPTKSEAQKSAQIPQAEASSGYTPWVLWDARYWLRLHVDQVHEDVSHEVRFLTPELYGEIRKKVGELRHYNKIAQPERWTVPVILSHRNGELIDADLPTTSINAGSELQNPDSTCLTKKIHCRYKHVDFHDSPERAHSIISTFERRVPEDDVMGKIRGAEGQRIMRGSTAAEQTPPISLTFLGEKCRKTRAAKEQTTRRSKTFSTCSTSAYLQHPT